MSSVSTSSRSSTPTIKYTPDPQADLVLRTADGTTFRVRRKYLDAASDVFEAMLALSTDKDAEKDEETGLPVVKLGDTPEEVDVMLRFLVRGQEMPDVSGLNVKQVASLWAFADKYDLKIVGELVVGRLQILGPLRWNTLAVLALALKHRHLPLTRATLTHLQQDFSSSQVDIGDKKKSIMRWTHKGTALNIADLPDDVWDDLPPRTMRKLVQLERKIFRGSTWATLSDEFEF